MVRLDELNDVCSNREVSNSIPAHIACRLLGNEIKPCVLDKICSPSDKHGVWSFYFILGAFATALFVFTFWISKLTRLSKVFYFMGRVIYPPMMFIVHGLISLKQLYDSIIE